MKTINKIGALLLASAFAVACVADDAPKLNSADAKVGMKQAEFGIKENLGLVQVPVSVEGEMNGVVRLTLAVEETGPQAAKEDVDYLITSKEIIVNSETKEGYVEILLKDNDVIEEYGARTFNLSIVEAEGAVIDPDRAKSLVKIKDNDANFYERLAGDWKGISGEDKIQAEIHVYPEGHPKYDKELVIVLYEPLNGVPCNFSAKYSFDPKSKKITLKMAMGETVAEGLNFGPGIGVVDIHSGLFNGARIDFKSEIEWELSDDQKSMKPVLEEGWMLSGGMFSKGSFNGYLFFAYPDLVLSK